MEKKKETIIKPAERAFVENYISPESDTYNNGTKSAMAAYNNDNYNSSAVQASDLLKKPKIQNLIREMTEKAGIGIQDRVDILATIARGKAVKLTEMVSKDKKGEIKSTTLVKNQPSCKDRINAIDVINKMDSTYTNAEAITRIAEDEYRSLQSDLFDTKHQSGEKI